MTRTVGLFPGQGSQYVGMGSRLADSNQVAASVFDRAGVATGIDVRELCWTGESSGLERTENAQLALTVFSLAAQSAFESEARTGVVSAFAGHSVGAIAAAAAAGYLSVESAAILARTRGRLMADAPGSGGMLAVAVPARGTREESHHFSLEMARTFDLDVAAHNGPRQVVLSGSHASLDAAAEALGAKAKRLKVSHAFHSRFMEPVESEWHEVLDSTVIQNSGRTYIGSTDGKPTQRGEEVREDLKRGLCQPVMWTSVMEATSDFQRLCVFGSGRSLARLARPYVRNREVLIVEDNVKHFGGANRG
ncbi:ACP S-malonyltransferase [Arthrobacter sp. efr-133-R2A-120]|uniref:ACP S-malonyltransferase n=1 Tax=Arthrobacter sp. efr-133-R2A-120 TaxID=3040277 RepID=UPI002550B825|nr:ACP S-malonyltransferase [Arthrobacter sp. efr-133-R2A-120]